jgi:hypothetical protein
MQLPNPGCDSDGAVYYAKFKETISVDDNVGENIVKYVEGRQWSQLGRVTMSIWSPLVVCESHASG